MAKTTSDEGALPVIQSEHAELMSLLRSLKRRLEGPPWQDAMVVSLLDSLREHLDTHFAFEESDEGFDDLARRAPWVTERIESLIAEHRQLLSSACDLAAQARGAAHTAPKWEELQASFDRLFENMTDHESREHDLLQEVYTQDVGDKD